MTPTPTRTRAAATVTALLAAAAILLPATAASADDVTWTVRTASNDLGADRTSYHYTVAPGSSVTDAVVITNRGADPLDLGVYASDGFTTKSGQFDLAVRGAKQTGIGAWVSGNARSVTVAPGQTVEYPFTLRVPSNATPGDYAGGIVSSLTTPDDSAAVNVDRRLGIRIALRVSGDLRPALAVEGAGVGWTGADPFTGRATLRYTLHNTGNAVLSARQTAELAGPLGAGRTTASRIGAPPDLLPGESWTVSIPFSHVGAMVWLSGRATVTPVVTDAAGSTDELKPIPVSAVGWAIPWVLLVVLLVLAAAVVAAVILLRRSRARRIEREDERVRRAVEDALAR